MKTILRRIPNDCSLVIPTIGDRESQLYDLLCKLFAGEERPHEVVIVTDAESYSPLFKELIAEIDEAGTRMRLIKSSKSLSSSAKRNIGMMEATGKYVLLLDDDVLPARNWLSEMRRALALGADLVGGLSDPIFIGRAKPIWWDDALLGNYVAVGNRYFFAQLSAIWSNNLGMTSAVARDVLFNTRLGMMRKVRVYGEDSEFVRRVAARGFRVVLSEGPVVYHRVSAERLTFSYLKTRAKQEGLGLKVALDRNAREMLIGLSRRFLRGFYYTLVRRRNILALPVHLVLLFYITAGWLRAPSYEWS